MSVSVVRWFGKSGKFRRGFVSSSKADLARLVALRLQEKSIIIESCFQKKLPVSGQMILQSGADCDKIALSGSNFSFLLYCFCWPSQWRHPVSVCHQSRMLKNVSSDKNLFHYLLDYHLAGLWDQLSAPRKNLSLFDTFDDQFCPQAPCQIGWVDTWLPQGTVFITAIKTSADKLNRQVSTFSSLQNCPENKKC